jgi:Xaa-Pro aminopeptidase
MPCNPLFYSFLVFLPEETFLFVEESQLNWPVLPSCQYVSSQVVAYYTTYASIRHRLPYASFHNFLVSHASSFKRWWVDPRSSISIIQALGSDKVFLHRSVVQEMKEIKNGTEISGMREAHARDCGAVVPPTSSVVVNVSVTYSVGWRIRFTLARWSRNQMYRSNLHSFRSTSYIKGCCGNGRQRMHYIGPSFETMACTAINAATVEYVPHPDTCAYITEDSMFMLDAGANYKFLPLSPRER